VNATTTTETSTDRANSAGADLYLERRGSGEPILFISGATGDAGHYRGVAAALADSFTTVAYDRRGNSRSTGAGPTTIAQQAEDAAALLEQLELAPAAVFGSSGKEGVDGSSPSEGLHTNLLQ